MTNTDIQPETGVVNDATPAAPSTALAAVEAKLSRLYQNDSPLLDKAHPGHASALAERDRLLDQRDAARKPVPYERDERLMAKRADAMARGESRRAAREAMEAGKDDPAAALAQLQANIRRRESPAEREAAETAPLDHLRSEVGVKLPDMPKIFREHWNEDLERAAWVYARTEGVSGKTWQGVLDFYVKEAVSAAGERLSDEAEVEFLRKFGKRLGAERAKLLVRFIREDAEGGER